MVINTEAIKTKRETDKQKMFINIEAIKDTDRQTKKY